MAGILGVSESTLSNKAYVATDDYGPVLIRQTILSGENLVKGTIVARQTSTGKFLAYDADGTDDGRRTAIGVLMEDVDASLADSTGLVGFAGHYVEGNMTGLDDDGKLALEARGVYFS
jgi:hypothetical protein